MPLEIRVSARSHRTSPGRRDWSAGGEDYEQRRRSPIDVCGRAVNPRPVAPGPGCVFRAHARLTMSGRSRPGQGVEVMKPC